MAGKSPLVTDSVRISNGGNITNEDGIITEIGLHQPRFDYGNDGLCDGLLLESETKNYLESSKTFTNALWSKTGIVVEGNRKRIQVFEGIVIARRNRGLNFSFIVRKSMKEN